MGTQPISTFQQSIWVAIQHSGNRIILRNQSSHLCVQKYLASTQSSLQINSKEIFQWRCSLPPNSSIVQLLQYGIKQPTACDRQEQLYVITQRVHRLSQIPKISKYQAFLLIKQTLIALKYLQTMFGLFSPDLTTIGVNQQGSVRVWIHQNYAINTVKQDQCGHPTRQQSVVNNLSNLITSIVYNNTLKGDYPNNLGFTKAIQFIDLQFKHNTTLKINKIYITRQQFLKDYNNKQNKFTQQENYSRSNKTNIIRASGEISGMTFVNTQQNNKQKPIYKQITRNQPIYNLQNNRPLQFKQVPHKNLPLNVGQSNSFYNNQINKNSNKSFQILQTYPVNQFQKPKQAINHNYKIQNNSAQQIKKINAKQQKINDKSQIRINNNIQQVQSRIIIQDQYFQERDKFPIKQIGFR